MFKNSALMFIIVETPLHSGSGSELGVVDLPIQRERHTGFPKIESSSLKGSIKEAFKFINTIEKDNNYSEKISIVFGPDEGDKYAGAVVFTDARLLLFPVKSLKGVFAWITCPIVLERLKRDLKIAGIKLENLENMDFSTLVNTVPKQRSELLVSSKVVLEEYSFEVRENNETTKIANIISSVVFPDKYGFWKEKLAKNLVVLSDNDFAEFVKGSTEVITRVRIDETGVVIPGALWTEEYLPQDTVLYSVALFSNPRTDNDEVFNGEAEKIFNFFAEELPPVIQIGGNQTIGKGLVRLNLYHTEAGDQK